MGKTFLTIHTNILYHNLMLSFTLLYSFLLKIITFYILLRILHINPLIVTSLRLLFPFTVLTISVFTSLQTTSHNRIFLLLFLPTLHIGSSSLLLASEGLALRISHSLSPQHLHSLLHFLKIAYHWLLFSPHSGILYPLMLPLTNVPLIAKGFHILLYPFPLILQYFFFLYTPIS